MSERFCIIVAHYNHAAELERCLPALLDSALPVLVVDDGSDPSARQHLRTLLGRHPEVELIERTQNGGKGAAIVTGIHAALARGFSHGITMDADGQHDAADLSRMQAAARANPGSIVSGRPVFGSDIPAVRRYGRMITNGLARLESGRLGMRDVMCGFRCYPLAVTAAVCDSYRVRLGMDFDPEVLVRASWRGVPVCFVDTRVRYPEGGVSHFRMFRDNVAMTSMHLRLIGGGLLRAPTWILGRRRGGSRRERGGDRA